MISTRYKVSSYLSVEMIALQPFFFEVKNIDENSI